MNSEHSKEQPNVPNGRPKSATQWFEQQDFWQAASRRGALRVSSLGQTFAIDQGQGVYTLGANPCTIIATGDRLAHINSLTDLNSETFGKVLDQFQGRKVTIFGSGNTTLVPKIETLLAVRQVEIGERQLLPSLDDSFTVVLLQGEIHWFIFTELDNLKRD